MQVTVIIKALNEERNVARAIESALNAVAECASGEVVVADSLSTDLTIEIAKRYPVKVVQLTNPKDRCCGVGAQLGFEMATGEYVYILDGDMELAPGFLSRAVALLQSDTTLAGVGGLVHEMNLTNLEFRNRIVRAESHMRPGNVDRLNEGGLYRRKALDAVGYFTNSNLHAYEELELAARLHAAGWRLHRIDVTAVRHFGHTDESYRLMLKRWRSGYAFGSGEVVRSALGTSHLGFILARLRILRFFVGVIVWWSCVGLLLGFKAPLSVWLLVLGLALSVLVALVVRKRSVSTAVYSVVSWHVFAAGFLWGLL